MKPRQIVALLALIGLFVALYLTLYKIGVIGTLTCSIGSCETVNTSRYSVLLGVPVAMWGLALYVVLLVTALVGSGSAAERSSAASWLLTLLSGWGVLFSGWLTYLELFRIHAICIWCVTSATILVLIFVTSLVDLRQHMQRVRVGPIVRDRSEWPARRR
ncbi:MAG TPA: vitamin K epoxide reductase family protein [Gemmatimonadaceae bacterium]|nr:vitamin K epoxide reductase family protein [Gemmatimonadaceae bacterium]